MAAVPTVVRVHVHDIHVETPTMPRIGMSLASASQVGWDAMEYNGQYVTCLDWWATP